jgi:hypothetical protein
VARPRGGHLVEHVPSGREDDGLHPEAPRQVVQVDLGDPADVRLALDDGRELGERGRVRGVEAQDRHP